MSRIFLTGDLHGEVNRLLYFNDFNLGLTKDDILIVLGDFGLIWEDKERTTKMLETLGELLDYTLAFVDGNHENFELIEELETISQWNKGYVGKLPGGIIHLIRGEIYNINGKRIGVCGGANSVDLWHRKEHESWWKEEDITNDDIDNFMLNLNNDNNLDIMLSHTCPAEILPLVALYSDANGKKVPIRNAEAQLEKINKMINVNKWYFGHWHRDLELDNKYIIMFKGIKEVL